MKKIKITIGLLLLGVVSFNLASDHFRYDLYKIAIAFEASHADLTPGSVVVNGESYAYLSNVEFLSGERKNEKAETVLMLHGFSASKENWLRFSTPLSEQYQLVALDLMGHGENSPNLNQSYSVEDQVLFVNEVVKALNLGRLHLVGNSMGGAISSLYAATYPDDVMSVTLISPAGVHDIPSEMDMLLSEGVNPLIAQSVEEFEQVMDFVMEDKPYIPSAITKVEAEKAAARIAVNQKIFADLRADMDKGLDVKFKDIKAPTLIIWGDHDRAINVKNIDKYAQLIPNAQKLVLEDIGHLAMLEAPQTSAKAMLAFID